MENFEPKSMQPKNSKENETTKIPQTEIVSGQPQPEVGSDEATQIETIQRKIDDGNKIGEIRKQLGIENRDVQIQSFISELPNVEGFVGFSQLQRVGHGGTHDVFVYPQIQHLLLS